MRKTSCWEPRRLILLRKKSGLSERSLCGLADISLGALRNYEKGANVPNLDSIARLSVVLNVPSDYFLGLLSPEQEKNILANYFESFENYKKTLLEHSGRMIGESKLSSLLTRQITPWPYNIVEDIVGEKEKLTYPLTDDQMKGLEAVIEGLDACGPVNYNGSKAKYFVLSHYRDGVKFSDLGIQYGVTRERARQIVARAIRYLRHRSNIELIKYGYEGSACRRKEKDLAKFDQQLAVKEKLLRIRDEEIRKKHSTAIDDILATPLDDLKFSVRTYNCLTRAGIRLLSDIIDWAKENKLSSIRGLGMKSYQEIRNKMQTFGLIIDVPDFE